MDDIQTWVDGRTINAERLPGRIHLWSSIMAKDSLVEKGAIELDCSILQTDILGKWG
jgi:hypothetical protein